MNIIYGIKAVFGVSTPKPIVGLPPGRARLRMRSAELAVVRVKNGETIRSFHLADCGEEWRPIESHEANVTVRNP